jgi:hypothetical protein
MFAPVLGQGPVYFAAGAYNPEDRATMKVPWPPPERSIAAGTGWTVAKAPLLTKKVFRQPLLARGSRVDGVGEVGFTGLGGKRPFAAMQFPVRGFTIGLGKYKAHSLTVWVAAAGCYALHLDGLTFSRVIVFRVEFGS